MKSNNEIKEWVENELIRQRQGLKDMPSAESAIFPCINLCEKLLQFITKGK